MAAQENDNARKYLSIQELSAGSGMSITQLRRLARAGRIPFFSPVEWEASFISHPMRSSSRPNPQLDRRRSGRQNRGERRLDETTQLNSEDRLVPRKPKELPIQCRHFTRAFSGVTESSTPTDEVTRSTLGKVSDTRDRREALKNLHLLDQRKAVEHGLAELKQTSQAECILIADGWSLFTADRGLPQELGGVGPNSLKRYRAIQDKHVVYCRTARLRSWDQVDRDTVLRYGSWLQRKHASRARDGPP